jgi:hypothetical protein
MFPGGFSFGLLPTQAHGRPVIPKVFQRFSGNPSLQRLAVGGMNILNLLTDIS